VGAALAQNNAPNRLATARARIAGSAVDIVLLLIITASAVCIDVVGNAGAAMLDRHLKNGGDVSMQFLGARSGEPVGAGARIDAGREERFIRVDIAHPTYKRLVEQQRLDVSAVAFKPCEKLRHRDSERVGAGAREETGDFRIEFNTAELPDVVKNQRAVIEFKNSARIFGASAVPQQLSRHA